MSFFSEVEDIVDLFWPIGRIIARVWLFLFGWL
jgi:hypothetical protein